MNYFTRFVLPVLLIFSGTTNARCQTPEEEIHLAGGRVFKVIVQTGLSLQWFDGQNKTFNFSAETQTGPYAHLGASFHQYLRNGNSYNELQKNSREFGVYAKFFLRGRLTARKSKLYIGPELRFGSRHYRYYDTFTFPVPENASFTEYQDKITKVMIRLGWQYHMDNVVFEVALPFGREYISFDDPVPGGNTYFYASRNSSLIVMPTLQMGICF